MSADNTNLNIILTGKNIEQVANHKILGVNLDQDLTFETLKNCVKNYQNVLDFYVESARI